MFRFSSVKRNVLPFVLFIFVGCLIILHQYSTLNPQPLNLPDGKIQLSKNCHHCSQLEDVELIKIPRFSSSSSMNSLTDEFLNESSRIRHVFFPKTGNPIHPRKGKHYYPGRTWLDSNGSPIQAHGGGILYDKISKTYYWYGENKDGPTYISPGKNVARVDIIGVSCYSSKDLWTWKNEGLMLKAEPKNTTHDLYKFNVLERPKVIYNDMTKKYVMWMHIDDSNYTKASVGVAVSDSPTGPFEYLYSKNPNGFDSRDMTIYKDDDDDNGRAYLIYSSMHNRELHISPLDRNYLDVGPAMAKALVGQYREAPALFKYGGKYYMITSGCSGWAPNEAMAHVADSVMGPWVSIGNPCVGSVEFRVATFFAQSTFVLPMASGERRNSNHDLFVFMADRWNPADLKDSRYVWLPLMVEVEDEDEEKKKGYGVTRPKVSIFWHEKWKIPKS